MNKATLGICVTVGGLIGGYVPLMFGQGEFSIWSIIGSTVGGLLGIVIAKRLDN